MEEVPFEYQYPLEKAGNNKDVENSFKNCIVLSNTPKGLVYMRYNKKEEGFEYWADDAIDYKYLETVARKYVTVFSCKDIYIDRFTLLKEKILNLKEQIEKNNAEKEEDESEDDEEEEEDVFANLKSYNIKQNNKTIKQTKILRDDVVCDKANKYLKRGKVKDANFGKEKEEKKQVTNSMSFGAWKLWKNTDKND